MHRKLMLIALFASFLVASASLGATDSDDQVVTLTVSEVADLVAGADITLVSDATVTPGAAPANETNSATNLQYTSVVDAPFKRTIQAKLTGSVPAGTSLKLTASSLGAGEGSGDVQITLSATDQDLITNIGSVNTGTAATDGPQMDYLWSIDNVQSLDTSTSGNVTVTFTMGEDA